MIKRILEWIFKAIVVSIWLFLAYACVYRAAEEIAFWNAMGGI